MNTVGKILVILNFLFAIIVGVLVVLNAALSNQWKDRYEKLLDESKALYEGRKIDNSLRPKIVEDFKRAALQQQEAEQKLKDKEDELAAVTARLQFEKAELENKLKDADTTQKAALEAKKRLTDELAILTNTIKEREVLIVKLEAESNVFKVNATNLQSLNNAMKSRNESMVEQIRDLTVKISRLQSGVNPDADVITNPNQPNPPAVAINGKIEFVNGDLVQVSLGTDHGLNKNNTLDVYRLQPNAKYLGMIRIVDAKAHSSVGRLVLTGNAAFRPQLLQGDLVSSKITR